MSNDANHPFQLFHHDLPEASALKMALSLFKAIESKPSAAKPIFWRQTPNPTPRLVDLDGMTVMPGLMNLHVHLSLIYPVGAQPPGWKETIPWRMLKSAHEALEAGVTLCRTTGEANHYDIGLRKAIDMGLQVGPRLVCAGRGITPTGGHGSDSPWYIEADGADDFRNKARRKLKPEQTISS